MVAMFESRNGKTPRGGRRDLVSDRDLSTPCSKISSPDFRDEKSTFILGGRRERKSLTSVLRRQRQAYL